MAGIIDHSNGFSGVVMLHKASMDSVMMFSMKLSDDKEIAPGFRLSEFQSRDGLDQILLHPLLVTGLVALREWAGGSVKINSAFRSVWHNSEVGGAAKSKHLLGMAADVVVSTKTPKEVAQWAEAMEFGGVGWYTQFTHIDVFGHGRRWDNRK